MQVVDLKHKVATADLKSYICNTTSHGHCLCLDLVRIKGYAFKHVHCKVFYFLIVGLRIFPSTKMGKPIEKNVLNKIAFKYVTTILLKTYYHHESNIHCFGRYYVVFQVSLRP